MAFGNKADSPLAREEPARICSKQIKRTGTRAVALLEFFTPLHEPVPSVLSAINTDSGCTAQPVPMRSSN